MRRGGANEEGRAVEAPTLNATIAKGAEKRPRRAWWAGAMATLPFWPGGALFSDTPADTALYLGGTPGAQAITIARQVQLGAAARPYEEQSRDRTDDASLDQHAGSRIIDPNRGRIRLPLPRRLRHSIVGASRVA